MKTFQLQIKIQSKSGFVLTVPNPLDEPHGMFKPFQAKNAKKAWEQISLTAINGAIMKGNTLISVTLHEIKP